MLNFVEAFLESATQLAVQLFILFAFDEPFTQLRGMYLDNTEKSITIAVV